MTSVTINLYRHTYHGWTVAVEGEWISGVFADKKAAMLGAACPEAAAMAWGHAHGHPMSVKFIKEFI